MPERTSKGFFSSVQVLRAKHWGTDTLFNCPKATGTQKCSACKTEKSVSDFYRKRDTGPGYTTECKACLKERNGINRAKRIERNKKTILPDGFTKLCSKCNTAKPAKAFSTNNQSKDRLTAHCNECRNTRFRKTTIARRRIGQTLGLPVSSKVCGWCGIEKPAAEFANAWQAADGLRRECRICQIIVGRNRRSTLQQYMKSLIWNGSYKGREERKLLTVEKLLDLWNIQEGKCVYTGLPMTHIPVSRQEVGRFTNASIDRIDNNKGYVVDNIQLVCFWANASKSCLQEDQFKYFLIASARHLNRQDKVMDNS